MKNREFTPHYKYFCDAKNGIVVCTSTYAKQPVTGVAKCAPSDTFDEEKGKALAKARCDYKVAKKRVANAKFKYEFLQGICEMDKQEFEMIEKYFNDSTDKVKKAESKLNQCLTEM